MNNIDNELNIKFKPMTLDRLTISIDRLTRFKNTEEKYLRVFKDILVNNLICPKYKKSDLDNFSYEELKNTAEYIINGSLKILSENYTESDLYINYMLKTFENAVFYIDDNTEILLDNKINYNEFLNILPDINIPNNLKWLKLLLTSEDPINESYDKGLKYPIKKLVLCEGITEEILLPVFADLLGYNFDKNGVQLVSAGGKNQVVKLFYKYCDELKIPIFVLLDSDAEENSKEIEPKLRDHDKIYCISSGEFEDILPKPLIERALKYSINNISDSPKEEKDYSEGTVHYLEEFYRTRGAHEFKKAEFAHIVKENISGVNDVSAEFKDIISEINNL